MGQSIALFPPGKGGGEEVVYGRKGKGILIHTLTEGNGMPLTNSTTAANGSEREQIFPLLDSVKLKTLKPGRPRKRVKVLAAERMRMRPVLAFGKSDAKHRGYDSKEKRLALRKRGIRPQLPKRNYKTKKNLGRPIEISVPRFQQERCLAWYQRKYRRLVVRWERQKANFDAFLFLATIHI